MIEPLVSIVVPAHNAAATIVPALRSALAQQGPVVEVIVVDDGSLDQTAAIVGEIGAGDRRVHLHRLAQAGGVAAARNHGIELSRGTWIATLDADDLFAPDRLLRLLDLAREADMVSDNLLLIDGPSGQIRGRAWSSGVLAAADPMRTVEFVERNRLDRKGFSFGYMCPIIRRDFMERHGLRYPTGLRIAEDYELYLECLLAGARWRILGEPLYHYVQWPKSLSRQLSREIVESMLRASRAQRERHPALPAEVAAAMRRRERGIELQIAHAAAVRAVQSADLGALLGALAAEPGVLPIFARACREGALKRLGLIKRHHRPR